MSVVYNALGSNGRLGNCLFQIAATIGLATKHNDTYSFPHWQYENEFNIHSHCFVDTPHFTSTWTENGFHYQEIPYSPNLNLSGYFQSHFYWDHCKDLILDLFTMKDGHDTIRGVTSVHIRRGDYAQSNLANSHYIDLAGSTDYYEQAMKQIGGNFMVFSDDVNYCRHKFANMSNVIVIDSCGDVISDLNIQSRCENNIIANSSFSYWAAVLNRNINKKVIAPLQWFGPQLSHSTADLCPPEWIKI